MSSRNAMACVPLDVSPDTFASGDSLRTGNMTVGAFVEAVAWPAEVIDEQGKVVCRNRLACVRPAGNAGGSLHRRIPLRVRGRLHFLVVYVAVTTDSRLSLSPRHLTIARLIAAGQSDKEIACHTNLAHSTVRTYVRRIFSKAGVRSRTELARMLWEAGY